MELIETPISGMYETVTEPFRDHRGAFGRLFCRSALHQAHQDRPIVQINHSRTATVGAIRGLHFQYPPKPEAKWVRCLKGQVYDVAVDVRRGSPTFLQWHAVVLDADRMNAVFIPEGCAHGFQVLKSDSELLYLHSDSYDPKLEDGIRFDDPRLAIDWPLPAKDVSERDSNHPLIDSSFEGVSL